MATHSADAAWSQGARSDRRLTIAAGCVGTLLSAAFITIDLVGPGVRPLELGVRLAHLVLTIGATVFVASRSAATSRDAYAAAFLLMTLPYLVSFTLSERAAAAAAELGRSWAPFSGHRLVLFGIAALAPGASWLGAILLATFVAHGAWLWLTLDMGAAGAQIPVDEPWASLAYAAMAAVLYGHRLHHVRAERALARARAEREAVQATNDALLTIRDLANTPLQVVTVALAVVRRRREGPDPVLDSADRAMARLRDLRELLPVCEPTRASPDPRALDVLRRAPRTKERAARARDRGRPITARRRPVRPAE
jgi:hypothetical protein